MPYQLTGILKLPDGTPAANVDIEFISQANYSPLVRDLSNTIRTSATGAYSVGLEYGEYAIRLLYASAYPLHPGKIYVYADTPAGQDLPTLMQAANWTPATPDYIVQIQNWLVEAKSAHDGSVASAAEAKASELAAKASEIAAEADRAEVATNKAAVSASQADVTTKQADVAAKATQVASDKAAAEAAKVAAVAASDTASQKAVLAAKSSALAQDAATRAEQSAQALVGALIDAGSYNAASGVLPAPVSVAGSERSCVWKVTGSGVAGGIDLGVGDSLVYTTSDGSYYKIVGANGLQAALNSKQPINTVLSAVSDGSIGAFSHRNKLINGGFRVNQRGYVSGAVTAANQYTLDRWKVSGTGGITFATVNGKTTITIPAGQTLTQAIEGVNLPAGGYVLSWGGTAQGRINSGAYGVSGAVNATLAGGVNATIEFSAGTLELPQFEPGSIATPFEHRPYGYEVSLCQRYYEEVHAFINAGAWSAHEYKATKRATATVVRLSGATVSTVGAGAPEAAELLGGTTGAVRISATAEL